VAPWTSDRELAPDLDPARGFVEGEAVSRVVATLR
jgi:hypothetical protein